MDPAPRSVEPAGAAPAPLDVGGKRLAWNTLLNVLGQAVPAAIVLVLAPYLIERLGTERTGILGVNIAIMSFAPLFDVGLGRALRKHVAEALGRGERARVPRIAGTTLLAQLATGGTGMLVLAVLAPFLAGGLLQIPPELAIEARTTFLLLALILPLTVVLESAIGVLEATQRFGLVNSIRVPHILGTALAPLVGVELGWDLARMTALQLVVAALAVASSLGLCMHVFPELRARPRFDREELRALLRFGGWVSVSNAVSPLLMYLDRIAIAVLVSMSAVTAYTAPFEAVTRLSLVPAALAATLFPAFSTLAGSGRTDVLRAYAARSVGFLFLFLGPPVLLTVVFSRALLERWIGADLAGESALALSILAVGVLVNALAYVPLSVVQARGRPDITALFHAIELPIHAALVFGLVWSWGIPGAALAWTLRVALDTSLLFWAARYLSRRDAVGGASSGGGEPLVVARP